jgi:hypothetical protein
MSTQSGAMKLETGVESILLGGVAVGVAVGVTVGVGIVFARGIK